VSEELRMLAHATKALAESNLGLGNVLREVVVSSGETNRILAAIHDQNAEILSQLEKSNGRQLESEKAIRVVQSTQTTHGRHIKRLEIQAGIPAAEQLSGPATSPR
jgi:hypothetical protein